MIHMTGQDYERRQASYHRPAATGALSDGVSLPW
jgi:hypothetical protein